MMGAIELSFKATSIDPLDCSGPCRRVETSFNSALNAWKPGLEDEPRTAGRRISR
jgi:hypothetical protein